MKLMNYSKTAVNTAHRRYIRCSESSWKTIMGVKIKDTEKSGFLEIDAETKESDVDALVEALTNGELGVKLSAQPNNLGQYLVTLVVPVEAGADTILQPA